mmetsp:Transcript_20806/g.45112  ORF Transcript_20806/g.45112 Transcript_20806/m.45112 type:complete len:414 (+) Transcript_20806:207-1448(+)
MMRGDDDIENGNVYNPSDSGGARQRRNAPIGNDNHHYSSIPTQQAQHAGYGPSSYDADSLKKKSASYSTPTFNTLSQRSAVGETPGGFSFFQSTAHLTEGLNQPYYRENFNDQPFSCDFGTGEENGIWMNTSDQAGTIMAFLVWLLLGYSAWTFTALAMSGGVPPFLSAAYVMLCTLALASHAKTTFSDPGSVPQAAVPNERMRREMGTPDQPLSMCSQCQTFKPPHSHHCRICNRCISRMDHHCPWMNNCVGVGNLKHFILFLVYTWTCSVFSLLLLGWNYFMCADEECAFNGLLTQLVRAVTVLSIGALLFTSSMIMNVTFGLMTGIGTIDRLKKKASNVIAEAIEEPIPLKDVFGIGAYWTWLLPIDPLFEDSDRVMGFSTPQRLLREEMRDEPTRVYSPSGLSKDMLSI